jgi:acetyl esterase/lipase
LGRLDPRTGEFREYQLKILGSGPHGLVSDANGNIWFTANFKGYVIAAHHIAVGGDSAGGGLTVTLITRLRDDGEELPCCAWLASPWTDLTMSGETLVTKDAVDPLIHKAYLMDLADAYLGPTMDKKDPRPSDEPSALAED